MVDFRDIEAEAFSPEDARGWLKLYVGAAHRLVWQGDTPEGDRQRCLIVLERALLAGSTDPAQRALVQLVNWWIAATRGEDVVGSAWQLAEPPGLAGALADVLRDHPAPALLSFRRPVLFRDAVAELDAHLDSARMPRLHVAPSPTIYGEARLQATEVRDAALRHDPAPPEGLRLVEADDDDLENWATERRGTRNLLRGVKVWFSLHKVLRELHARVAAVVERWTVEPLPRAPLPADWRGQLHDALGDDAEIVEGLLADLEIDRPARPDCFTPEWTLQALGAVPRSTPFSTRVRLLALVREARAAAPAESTPAWAEETESELAGLLREARTVAGQAASRGVEEARESVAEAVERLNDLDAERASEWIQLAREALAQAEVDSESAALERQGQELLADLVAAGESADDLAPGPGDDLAAVEQWFERIEARWTKLAGVLRQRHEDLALRAKRLPESAALENALRALQRADTALKRGALGQAAPLLGTADQAVGAARAQLEPELERLLDRRDRSNGLGPSEQDGFDRMVRLIRNRAAAELDYLPLIERAVDLLEVLDAGGEQGEGVLGVVVDDPQEGGLEVFSLCWVRTGVPVDPERARLQIPSARDLPVGTLVEGAGPGAPAEPLSEGLAERLAELRPIAGAAGEWTLATARAGHGEIQTIFGLVEATGRVVGPLREAEGALVPADPRDFVAELDEATFFDNVMEIHLEDGRRLLLDAPPLDVLIDELGAEPRDPMGANQQERWLANLLADFEDVRGKALAACMVELDQQKLPDSLLQGRIRKLSRLIEVSRWLGNERERAAAEFLKTPEGQRAIELAASRHADAQRAELVLELAAEREAMQAEMAQLEARLVELRSQEEEERAKLDRELRETREDIEQANRLRETAIMRVIARVTGLATGPRGPAPSAPVGPFVSTRVATRPFTTLRALGDGLCQHLGEVDDQLLRSLLATFLTTPWILFAGPPGGGKSTLARDLANAFGAVGPRRLEIVVRREWQDDGALFGFWHPQQQVWMPSSDGLVEFLLRADHDWHSGSGALHLSIFEELNLASPEYYLSRLISALEDDAPRVRLYGADEGAGAGAYPAAFPVHENVRLVGTVNVDETVERLSPRFLSRAAIIWLQPAPHELFGGARAPTQAEHPIDWRAAVAHAAAEPAGDVQPLEPLVQFLHARRVPGAPTRRTVTALQRYLAVAQRILPAQVAQDFAITQRVLPPLRGVGARYQTIFQELQERLARGGWQRSATMVERILERGVELGDYFDFFHA